MQTLIEYGISSRSSLFVKIRNIWIIHHVYMYKEEKTNSISKIVTLCFISFSDGLLCYQCSAPCPATINNDTANIVFCNDYCKTATSSNSTYCPASQE